MEHSPLVEIGYIQRTHGIKGEVQLVLNDIWDGSPENLESVFLEIEGIPTPFFVDYVRQKTDEKVIVKFDDCDNLDEADGLVGFKVLVEQISEPQSDEVELKDLVGFTLFNQQNERIGVISRYEDYGLNAVYAIEVEGSDDEVLIPATDEIIIEFDDEERTVVMSLPDGLFTLGEE